LLSSWGVPFEGVDVEAHPDRKRELEPHGVPRVPATIHDGRAVHGWNPKALAELVGVKYETVERLAPDELARRMDRVLAATQRIVAQLPPAALDTKAPDRNRTVRQIAWHVFRLSLWFRETRETGMLPDTAYNDADPATIGDAAQIVRFGDEVRAKLGEWFRRPGWCHGSVETYYGPQTAHDFMERTTWHAAQHLRQLYWFAGNAGVTPEAPLGDRDFEGLPLPNDVWS
jgi:hypothetical protein